jgi:DNA recombination protein RmuC
LNAFVRDVRARVKELTTRGYADPETTAGYVLLFIPNESVYAFIQEHDRELGDFALAHDVVLTSPFTLFAVLGVIRHAVDCFLLERASDEILVSLGRFSDQWARFSDQLDRLGKQLGTAQSTYDDLAGVRRRQLEKRLDEIDNLRTARGLDPPDETPCLREVNAF